MFNLFSANISKKQAPREINIRIKVDEGVGISEVCAHLARWFLSDDATIAGEPRDKMLQSMRPDDRVDIEVSEKHVREFRIGPLPGVNQEAA